MEILSHANLFINLNIKQNLVAFRKTLFSLKKISFTKVVTIAIDVRSYFRIEIKKNVLNIRPGPKGRKALSAGF